MPKYGLGELMLPVKLMVLVWASTAIAVGDNPTLPDLVDALNSSVSPIKKPADRSSDCVDQKKRERIYNVVSITVKDGVRIKGYLYTPKAFVRGKSRSILYLHGGPNPADPDRRNEVREYLLAQGFVVLDIDYRNCLSFPNEMYPDVNELSVKDFDPTRRVQREAQIRDLLEKADIEDGLAGIRFLRQYTAVNKVAVVGHSAGANIANRLAFSLPSEVAAVINLEDVGGNAFNFSLPDELRALISARNPFQYMNEKNAKVAAPILSYYGLKGGAAIPAGRGRLDHEDSHMVHGNEAIANRKTARTDFYFARLPEVDPRHIYLEYQDGHFPHSKKTLDDLLPKILSFLNKHQTLMGNPK
ncbi:MAG: hypothetical protein A2428_07685 [Bdellovibrionales bacterium RIFOXYC1_FULL_54_43]|nr:MAG: hypothetical protein A2428_07685 [Bdellovibrionales bacterium RIFOXYC1_FULL_54_43]OFZ79515.1 MAG: hypothetical protein A2603_09910 [Bdellovibrionales bacterium RIFOXYD1_FULL_55_31]